MVSRRLKAVQPAFETPTTPTRGFVVGWERNKGILVELADSADPVLAQSLVELTEAELDSASAEHRAAMVVFEDGDRARPVILGLLAPLPARPKPVTTPATTPAGLAPAGAGAVISDDVVLVRGHNSIELRCGAASITLRKDGRIVVRGTDVISRASNQNRIVGGSVHFN